MLHEFIEFSNTIRSRGLWTVTFETCGLQSLSFGNFFPQFLISL